METPHVDEFMGYYNACVGTSSYAVVHFREITGYSAKKKSATRWFSTNDVQELSLLPNAANGNLLRWLSLTPTLTSPRTSPTPPPPSSHTPAGTRRTTPLTTL